MPLIPFAKYHGTGNDFILIDNRHLGLSPDTATVAALCHRRFGIGADGLMLLEDADGYDFRMVYFNSDGREGSMCGNGGRCITRFAADLGIIKDSARFIAVDGPHEATVEPDGIIRLHMADTRPAEAHDAGIWMHTGSPHLVLTVDGLNTFPVAEQGRGIRYSKPYSVEGVNVNFVERIAADRLSVRTYERGVEDETLSCGTGVTACALALGPDSPGRHRVDIFTPGGELHVSYERLPNGAFRDIWLEGPAVRVFEGQFRSEDFG